VLRKSRLTSRGQCATNAWALTDTGKSGKWWLTN
jgi:hypothetical protein